MWQITLKVVLIIFCAAPLLARADFEIKSAQVTIGPNELLLNSNLDLSINPEIEEALNRGISLTIFIECELYKERPVIWDKSIQQWRFEMNMRYHALSSRYIVSQVAQQSSQSFDSAEAALQFMGDSKTLRLPLSNTKTTEFDENHRLAFRVRLDIESLPAPLRPVAYTSNEWRLSSPWTQWTIQK